jgi:hypothetical protein
MSPEEVNAALNRPFDIVVRTGGAFRLSGAPIIECSSADMFSATIRFASSLANLRTLGKEGLSWLDPPYPRFE